MSLLSSALILLATAALGWLLFRLEGALRLLDRQAVGLETRVDGLGAQVGGLGAQVGGLGAQVEGGLRQANQTFADVLQRLGAMDEAQRHLQALTREVVGLEALLGDKRARGAFGEVQLESLVQNVLPPAFYRFQHTLSTGVRVDCLLQLPEPTGHLAVDAKFPLENYRRSLDPDSTPQEREDARRRLKADVRAHIDAIASKYILPGETAGGAVMFIPAESLFAEIHGHLPEVVEHAQRRDVWLTSPTTLFALLHTVAGLIKDASTRAHGEQIRVELGRLAADFTRFDQRLASLARHQAQLAQDLEALQVSGRQISRRFAQIADVRPAEEEGG